MSSNLSTIKHTFFNYNSNATNSNEHLLFDVSDVFLNYYSTSTTFQMINLALPFSVPANLSTFTINCTHAADIPNYPLTFLTLRDDTNSYNFVEIGCDTNYLLYVSINGEQHYTNIDFTVVYYNVIKLTWTPAVLNSTVFLTFTNRNDTYSDSWNLSTTSYLSPTTYLYIGPVSISNYPTSNSYFVAIQDFKLVV